MAIQSLLIIVAVLAVLLVAGVPISYSHRYFLSDRHSADSASGRLGDHRRTAHFRRHEQIQPDRHSLLHSGRQP